MNHIQAAEQRIQNRLTNFSNFEEQKHPRANDGKFSSKGNEARGKVREAEARVAASVKGKQRVTGRDVVNTDHRDVEAARKRVAETGHSQMNPYIAKPAFKAVGMYKITHEGGHVATRNHDDRRPPEVGDVVGGRKVSKVERVGDHPGLTLAGKIGHNMADHLEHGEELGDFSKDYDSMHTDHKTYARHELHDRGLLSEDYMHDHGMSGRDLMSRVKDAVATVRRRGKDDAARHLISMRANGAY